MNWLHRFMYGRYGSDQLSITMAVTAILLSLVNRFLRFGILDIICYLLIAAVIYRLFSRDVTRRRRENQMFLSFMRPVTSKMRLLFNRMRPFTNTRSRSDKEHRYFSCPQCGQLVRVPRGKGRIIITCPSCKFKFKEKT